MTSSFPGKCKAKLFELDRPERDTKCMPHPPPDAGGGGRPCLEIHHFDPFCAGSISESRPVTDRFRRRVFARALPSFLPLQVRLEVPLPLYSDISQTTTEQLCVSPPPPPLFPPPWRAADFGICGHFYSGLLIALPLSPPPHRSHVCPKARPKEPFPSPSPRAALTQGRPGGGLPKKLYSQQFF